MPFGLDVKSLIVGLLLAYFIIPFVRGKLLSASAHQRTQTTSGQ